MIPTMNVAIYLYTHHAMVHCGYVSHVLAHEEQVACPTPMMAAGRNIIIGSSDSGRDWLN